MELVESSCCCGVEIIFFLLCVAICVHWFLSGIAWVGFQDQWDAGGCSRILKTSV